ncbi:MAG: right-handed parallel beta-helix repeat-containing protein, partial [Planctomycetota bacterium]
MRRCDDLLRGLTHVMAVVSSLAIAAGAHGGSIVYVNQSAPCDGDGLSWATAYCDLQSGLLIAAPGTSIWVAAGTYTPDQGQGNRSLAFVLHDDVALYGGFAGGETDLSERDVAANPTILSGDLAGDDGPDFAQYGENSYHVVSAIGVGPTAVLDGFTITGGNADGEENDSHGGGILCDSAAPTITGCTFTANLAINRGGAAYNLSGTPSYTGCTFEGNRADNGGAMYNESGTSVSLSECTFAGNDALGDGGAIYNVNCSPIVTSCDFTGNTAPKFSSSGGGGAMLNAVGSGPIAINCTFTDNFTTGAGGAVRNRTSTAVFIGCTFTANTAGRGGAAWHDNASTPTYLNCTFDGNHTTTTGGAIHSEEESTITLTGCVLTNNTADAEGGGIHVFGSDMILTDCEFSGNESLVAGGAIHVWRCQGNFDGGTIGDNVAPVGSGIYNLVGDLTGGTHVEASDDVFNSGYLFPGLAETPMVFDGLYHQEHRDDFLFRIPRVFLDVSGTV